MALFVSAFQDQYWKLWQYQNEIRCLGIFCRPFLACRMTIRSQAVYSAIHIAMHRMSMMSCQIIVQLWLTFHSQLAYFARLQTCVFAYVHSVLHEQVYLGDAEWAGDGEGEGQDPLGNVVCMECGRGDDEDNLMLCDGAVCAFCNADSHFATELDGFTVLQHRLLMIDLAHHHGTPFELAAWTQAD